MTLNDINRAALALFAAREAGPEGSLEEMKAIALCIRNRVRAGWGDWIDVMEHAQEYAANPERERFALDMNRRAVQRMIADVDDLYYGAQANVTGQGGKEPTAQRFATEATSTEEALEKCLYWADCKREFTAWFKENILRNQQEHRTAAQMGIMMFFE